MYLRRAITLQVDSCHNLDLHNLDLERPLLICNSLIVYSLELSRLAAHTFSHYFIAVMHQLLDWFAISLLERDEEIYRIIVHCFVMLTILIVSQPVYMLGILQRICASLIQLTSGPLIDFDAAGRS